MSKAIWTIRVAMPDGELRHRIDATRPVVVGRKGEADIAVEHVSVSRRHASLEARPDGVWVVDLGSSNGTRLGGERVSAGLWHPDVALRLGDVEVFLEPVEPGTHRKSRRVDAGHGSSADAAGPSRSRGSSLDWIRRLFRKAPPELRLYWHRRGQAALTETGRWLAANETLVIGSDLSATIVLDDPTASRRHAEISTRQGVVVVTDLGSTNGTFLNGTRIEQPERLETGETVSVGAYDFVVRSWLHETATERAIETILFPANRFEKAIRSVKSRLRVFISYARGDMAIADRLEQDLAARGFEILMDRSSLPFGESWMEELARLVRTCDTVLFVATPASVGSRSCRWELDLCEKLRKRVVPIVGQAVPITALPESLGRIQLLPAVGVFDIDRDLPALIQALNTDQAWVKEHSRLASRAREWLGRGKPATLLLRSETLRVALAWVRARPPSEGITPEIIEFIVSSRDAARRRFRYTLAGVLLAAGAAGAGSYPAWRALRDYLIEYRTVYRTEYQSKYVSEFLERLSAALEDTGFEIKGDRFIIQSDVFFPSGQAVPRPEGVATLKRIAAALKKVAERIETDDRASAIDWVFQIDGHTDKRPIRTARFPSNWELSTERANSVVRFMIEQGVPPKRLAAAGYADTAPVEEGETEKVLARNRRIELKLTTR